nr:expressed protein [Hymenolepis microstoma]
MAESSECPYCNENFKDSDEFWRHINSLSCNPEYTVKDAPNSPPGPPSVPSNEVNNGDDRSFDMVTVKINLPSSSQLLSPGSQPTKPVTNSSLNKNLFSKMESSNLAAEASSAFSQAPKWKCTLCNVEFAQKQAMIAHVRSAEHEARISMSTTSSGDRSQSLVQPKPTVAVTSTNSANVTNIVNTCIKEDELVFMIRQIVREELRSMFRSLCDDIKKPELSSPFSSGNIPTKNYANNFIQINGQCIRCEACNCSLSSLTNLSHHVEGKRHKTTVARLTAPATFS